MLKAQSVVRTFFSIWIKAMSEVLYEVIWLNRPQLFQSKLLWPKSYSKLSTKSFYVSHDNSVDWLDFYVISQENSLVLTSSKFWPISFTRTSPASHRTTEENGLLLTTGVLLLFFTRFISVILTAVLLMRAAREIYIRRENDHYFFLGRKILTKPHSSLKSKLLSVGVRSTINCLCGHENFIMASKSTKNTIS